MYLLGEGRKIGVAREREDRALDRGDHGREAENLSETMSRVEKKRTRGMRSGQKEEKNTLGTLRNIEIA